MYIIINHLDWRLLFSNSVSFGQISHPQFLNVFFFIPLHSTSRSEKIVYLKRKDAKFVSLPWSILLISPYWARVKAFSDPVIVLQSPKNKGKMLDAVTSRFDGTEERQTNRPSDRKETIEKYLYSKDLIDFFVKIFVYMILENKKKEILSNLCFFLFISNCSICQLHTCKHYFKKFVLIIFVITFIKLKNYYIALKTQKLAYRNLLLCAAE